MKLIEREMHPNAAS